MECIERVARALCECEGKDPEEPHFTNKMAVSRENGHMVQRHLKVPLWTTYVDEARKFIAVYTVLGSVPDIAGSGEAVLPLKAGRHREA